jgi:ankyrin repeat protein
MRYNGLLAAGEGISMATPAQQMLAAVLAGDADTVASLLDADPGLANLVDRTPSRYSVLHYAASRGDLAVVELLLVAGANVDKRTHDGSIPLHEAALGGHLDVARALVAAGAETRATTNSGYSVLDAARVKGIPGLIELLMSLPQPSFRYTFRGKREWS